MDSSQHRDRSAFRFTRVVLDIETDTPSQKAVLTVLAIRADHRTGTCHPSYDRLCRDTGFSRSVVASALVYLRDKLKVVTWKRGHGNQHSDREIANVYTLDYAAMKALGEISAESDDRTQRESVAKSDWPTARSDSQCAKSDSTRAKSDSRTLTAQLCNYSHIQLLKESTGAGHKVGAFEDEKTDGRDGVATQEALGPAAELSKTGSPTAELSRPVASGAPSKITAKYPEEALAALRSRFRGECSPEQAEFFLQAWMIEQNAQNSKS